MIARIATLVCSNCGTALPYTFYTKEGIIRYQHPDTRGNCPYELQWFKGPSITLEAGSAPQDPLPPPPNPQPTPGVPLPPPPSPTGGSEEVKPPTDAEEKIRQNSQQKNGVLYKTLGAYERVFEAGMKMAERITTDCREGHPFRSKRGIGHREDFRDVLMGEMRALELGFELQEGAVRCTVPEHHTEAFQDAAQKNPKTDSACGEPEKISNKKIVDAFHEAKGRLIEGGRRLVVSAGNTDFPGRYMALVEHEEGVGRVMEELVEKVFGVLKEHSEARTWIPSRVHEGDMAGRVQEDAGGFDQLKIPSYIEYDPKSDPQGFSALAKSWREQYKQMKGIAGVRLDEPRQYLGERNEAQADRDQWKAVADYRLREWNEVKKERDKVRAELADVLAQMPEEGNSVDLEYHETMRREFEERITAMRVDRERVGKDLGEANTEISRLRKVVTKLEDKQREGRNLTLDTREEKRADTENAPGEAEPVGRIIREVKPITRQKIKSTVDKLGLLSPLGAERTGVLLRELGIEIEDNVREISPLRRMLDPWIKNWGTV